MHNVSLTFDKEKAIHYVGGAEKHENIFQILEELTDNNPRDNQGKEH